MTEASVDQDVPYSAALVDHASSAFFHHFFRTRFGRILMLASLVNIGAFLFLVYLGLTDRFVIFVVGLIALLGPIHLSMIYFLYPRKVGAALKSRLVPSARVTISSSGFGIAASGRAVSLLWSDVKSILELPE